jgi:hypothetical protein
MMNCELYRNLDSLSEDAYLCAINPKWDGVVIVVKQGRHVIRSTDMKGGDRLVVYNGVRLPCHTEQITTFYIFRSARARLWLLLKRPCLVGRLITTFVQNSSFLTATYVYVYPQPEKDK